MDAAKEVPMSAKRGRTGWQEAQTSLFVVPNSTTPQWQPLPTETREAARRLITQMYERYLSGSHSDANEQGEMRDE
jgi:hypothetical protein